MIIRTWKGAFAGAYRKGYEAGKSGKSIKNCPYSWKPGPYAAAEIFERAWKEGWEEARKKEKP